MKKKIVIMGATSGIGLEVARLFHREGHPVAIAGRRIDNLQRISAELGNCPYAQIDVTDPNAPALLQGLIGQLGGMDIYLHVSGIGKQNRQLDTTIELSTVETNAMGFTRMTRKCVPAQVEATKISTSAQRKETTGRALILSSALYAGLRR